MWFIGVVIAVGALISLLVFGSAAYLQATGSTNMARSLTGPVPLPKARPVAAVRQPDDNEPVRELKAPKQKQRRARRDL